MAIHRCRVHAAIAILILFTHLLALSLPIALPGTALAQTTNSKVEQAREFYDQARFDEAISLLRELIDKNALASDDLLRAREILARCYVKKGYPGAAKDLFLAILKDDPAYRPDSMNVPPDESDVFNRALKEYEQAQQALPSQAPSDTSAASPQPSATVPRPTAIRPVVPPSGVESVRKPRSKTIWYILGAGVLAGIVAAASGGGSASTTPPETALGFPSPPSP